MLSANVDLDASDLIRCVWRYGKIRWYHGSPIVFFLLPSTFLWNEKVLIWRLVEEAPRPGENTA